MDEMNTTIVCVDGFIFTVYDPNEEKCPKKN